MGGGSGKANLDFYGAGLGLPELNGAYRFSLQFTGAITQANWTLAPRSPWAVGLRYVDANVDPEPREPAVLPGVAERVTVSAPTAILEYDSRNNVFTPTRGIYSETSYLVSRSALGSSVDFDRFQQVLLAWKAMPHDITLGVHADYAWSSRDTPFFLRPYIQLRGVPAVRCATRLARSAATTDGQSVASGGIGFRYELARKFGLHAGLDLAHSTGTTAVYIQIGNAWFRP